VEESIIKLINEAFMLEKQDIRTIPSLTLAYLGDCIYELTIRTLLVGRKIMHVSDLSRTATGLVRASAQKAMFHSIEDALSEEEMSVFKRGRNVRSSTTAKSATVGDYRIATGFEALLGYLYLSERYSRITELVKLGLDRSGLLDTGVPVRREGK